MVTLELLLLLFTCTPAASGDWPPAPAFERPEEVAGSLPESVEALSLGVDRWRVRFALGSDVQAERVFLAGSFNGWEATAMPMARGSDGRWSAELELTGGRHLYKFVLEGSRWIPDPLNVDREPDGHGGENSVLSLGHLGRLTAGDKASLDASDRLAAYRHRPGTPMHLQRRGSSHALVRYLAPTGEAEAPRVALEGETPVEMHLAGEVEGFALYEAEVGLPEAPARYTFLVSVDGAWRSDPQTFWLDAEQLPAFRTPEWAKHATWYQIMPDRFRNATPANYPENPRPWTSDWYEPAEHEDERDLWRGAIYKRHYGGDLEGVLEKLDYIQSLGVTALYFNPVFEAESHHKYDASDYRHVDTHLGRGEDWRQVVAEEDLLDPESWTWSPSDRLFLELLAACHARGMKVIIDGVWNHVGQRHPAFADVREKGPESAYSDWFDVVSFEPFVHRGWAGFGELPVFKKDAGGFSSAAVEGHVFAVTRRWMDPDGDGDPSDGVDGWRLDVPMEIPMPFWDAWHDLVKSINPDAYLSGEVWDRADVWLNGSRFDAVMNYPFAESVIAWVGHERDKISASELDRRLAALRLAYPVEATLALMNLVDSHDTDRLVSMLLNPDRRYDAENREQDNPGYLNRKPDALHYRRARLIALLQMTYVGAPMVYYGDEVGMWGPDDPSNRKPMLWQDLGTYAGGRDNRVEAKHLAHYRAVGALRRAHPALRAGSFRTLLTDDEQDLFVFIRQDEHEEVLVALNAGGERARFELPGGEAWTAAYGEADGRGRVSVPPIDGLVLVR